MFILPVFLQILSIDPAFVLQPQPHPLFHSLFLKEIPAVTSSFHILSLYVTHLSFLPLELALTWTRPCVWPQLVNFSPSPPPPCSPRDLCNHTRPSAANPAVASMTSRGDRCVSSLSSAGHCHTGIMTGVLSPLGPYLVRFHSST